jgi:Cd2+/Zn2+-exporting ATPase
MRDMGRARCTLKVQGLDCPNEVGPLRAALEGGPGVDTLGFDLIHGMLTIDYDPEVTEPAALVRRIATRAGMKADLAGAPEVAGGWWSRHGRWASTAASGLALLVGVLIGWWAEVPSASTAAYALAVAAGGLDLVPRAARSLRLFRLDIHVLMLSAILGAIALGEWDEAATVAFLFGLSEALEALSVDRARRAVRALLEVAPETAEVVGPDGSVSTVAASEVRKGDRVRIRSGERVPVDGSVVSGRSSVDQKAITGESVPVLRERGDTVFAGSVNGEGALEVEASGTLDDSLISKVADRVREAQASRAPVERTVERFASWYTPMVVVISLMVMVGPPMVRLASGSPADWSTWFARGLVILVIACPCALVIATPVALASALAAAARRGILLKGGQFLEEIGRLRVLAFDKTGTLTLGMPDVVEVVPTDGRVGDDLLRIAAALSDQGGHVLGRAISRHARTLRLEVPVADGYEAVPGLGASGRVGSEQYHIGSHRYIDESGLCPPDFHARLGRAEGDVGTSVALTTASGPIGWIRLADRPRPEAAAVLAELAALGIETVMLTGDNHPTAAAMARELGIADQRSGLLPADKAQAIAELNDRRGPTGMVGDGVNDAPALAAARVSVALGGISSASALETADVVLMADDLAALPWLVRLGRETLSRIRQNIALALGSKLLVLILAVFGMATLWMAILADVGVSLLVTANALRLLRRS